jgi:cob(I)alamin adenosyltransferase
LPLNDGEDIILANTEIKDETKHTRLLQLFLKSDSFYDEMFPAISEAFRFYKDTERGQESMSEISKILRQQGYELGLADGIEKEKKKTAKEKKRADKLEKEVEELKKKLESIQS